jgi:hypothetical protein
MFINLGEDGEVIIFSDHICNVDVYGLDLGLGLGAGWGAIYDKQVCNMNR